MSAVAIVVNKLLAASEVTAVVGTKVYPVLVPQGIALPAITINLISTVDQPHLNGPGLYYRSIVQVDVIGTTASFVLDAGEKVIAALNGIIKATVLSCEDVDVLLDSGSDFTEYDETATSFRRVIRFAVRWRSA